MPANELGDFLRSRRGLLSPEDAGLHSHGIRRVPGLRREEVAILAGLSADYYTRLEQGRERNPSAQVLDALARTLRLDADQEMHLYRLARLAPSVRGPGTRKPVGAALRRLLDTFDALPALVLNPALDIVAANRLAEALFAPFAVADNLARMVFTDAAAAAFYADWPRAARATVATLRLAAGHSPGPDLTALIEELSAASPAFRRLWAEGDVRGKTREAKHLVHPDVGPLSVTFQAFDVRDEPGRQLIVYQAEPGSPSEQALTLLGALTATRERERREAGRP